MVSSTKPSEGPAVSPRCQPTKQIGGHQLGLTTVGVSTLVCTAGLNPLATYIVAQTLRPRRVKLIASLAAQRPALRLQHVLRSEGLDAHLALGLSGTDLDATDGQLPPLRQILTEAIGADVILDYTDGSKLAASEARSLLGLNADRAVYLAGERLRWDDGRSVMAGVVPVSIGRLFFLYGAAIEARHRSITEVSEHERQESHRLAAYAARVDPSSLMHERQFSEVCHKALANKDDAELHELCGRLRDGTLLVFGHPFLREGDWLEVFVADQARLACPSGTVLIGVQARRGADPVVTQVTAAARQLSAAAPPPDAEEALASALELLEQGPSDRPSGATPSSGAGAKLELDVSILRGHRLHVISCYTGTDTKQIRWKAAEAIQRARQVGGDLARAALVAPMKQQAAQDVSGRLELEWTAPNRPKVFGVEDIRRWLAGDRTSLSTWLSVDDGEVRRVPSGPTPRKSKFELVSGVGGSPEPPYLAALTRRARSVLLVHGSDVHFVAENVQRALERHGTEVDRLTVDSFLAGEIAAALTEMPKTGVDITAGTKVLGTQLRTWAEQGDPPAGISYVDFGARCLRFTNGTSVPLDDALDLVTALELHGFDIVPKNDASRSRDLSPDDAQLLQALVEGNRPTRSKGVTLQRIKPILLGETVRAIAEAVPNSELRSGVKLKRRHDGQELDPPLLISTDVGLSVMAAAPDNLSARDELWRRTREAEQLAGTRGRAAVVCLLDEKERANFERGPGASWGSWPKSAMFGREDLRAWAAGDFAALERWLSPSDR